MYRYIDYLPDFLADIKELQALGECTDFFMSLLQGKVNQAQQNEFIETADVAAILRLEKILALSAPMSSTLKARRDAVIAKMMTKPPINVKTLQAIVEAYMGVPVDIEVQDFVVKIKYRGQTRTPDLSPLYATAYEIIPANLLMNIAYLYVTWGEVQTTYPTWGDTLGKTWGDIHKGV